MYQCRLSWYVWPLSGAWCGSNQAPLVLENLVCVWRAEGGWRAEGLAGSVSWGGSFCYAGCDSSAEKAVREVKSV